MLSIIKERVWSSYVSVCIVCKCACVYVCDLSDLVNLWTVYLLIIHFHRIKLLTNIKIYPDKFDCEPYLVTPKISFHRKGKKTTNKLYWIQKYFISMWAYACVFCLISFQKKHLIAMYSIYTKDHEWTTQDAYVIILMNWLWYNFLYHSHCWTFNPM